MTSDPLVFLRATLDAVQAEAEAATAGPWFAHEYIDYACDFEATIGTGNGQYVDDKTDVVGHGYEGGGVAKVADAQHIARHHPAAVLRRIAADRKQLELHAAVPDHGRFSERTCAETGCDGEHDEPPVCRSCRTYAGDPVEAPCDTVEILAESWGWTEEEPHADAAS